MKNFTTADLSKKAKTEIAIKLVILDAIEKGHTNLEELKDYMMTNVFKSAVANYITLMNK